MLQETEKETVTSKWKLSEQNKTNRENENLQVEQKREVNFLFVGLECIFIIKGNFNFLLHCKINNKRDSL